MNHFFTVDYMVDKHQINNLDAQNEKIEFLKSKISIIEKIFKKSSIQKKVFIIFFLRLKNNNEINLKINKLISSQNFFFDFCIKDCISYK